MTNLTKCDLRRSAYKEKHSSAKNNKICSYFPKSFFERRIFHGKHHWLVGFLSLYLGQIQSVTDRRAIRQWEALFVHLPHGLLHWVKSSPGPALMGREITWSSRWEAVCHGIRLTSVVSADLFQEQCLHFVFVLFSHRFSNKNVFHHRNHSVLSAFKQTAYKRKVKKSAIIHIFF